MGRARVTGDRWDPGGEHPFSLIARLLLRRILRLGGLYPGAFRSKNSTGTFCRHRGSHGRILYRAPTAMAHYHIKPWKRAHHAAYLLERPHCGRELASFNGAGRDVLKVGL